MPLAVLALTLAALAAPAPAGYHAELSTPPRVRAGEPASLSFLIRGPSGSAIRFLQNVHERPMHLLIVSEDLAEFDHVHPDLQADDSYGLSHTFAHGGRYALYADYTPPGSGAVVDRFVIDVEGPRREPVRLVEDARPEKTIDGLRARLTFDRPLRAGDSVLFAFALSDSGSGAPVTDLQLFLDALAHVVVISEDRLEFIHAHPLEAGEVFDPSQDPKRHVHDPVALEKRLVGPSPSSVSTYVTFPKPGLYKMWAQFRRNDAVISIPFVLDVAAASATASAPQLERGALRIEVTSSGYTPSRLVVKAGETVELVFHRGDDRNCARTVVFPKLGITRELPAGETVTITFTPKEPGEISFTCGMGMFGGTVVVE